MGHRVLAPPGALKEVIMSLEITHDSNNHRYVAWVDEVPAGLIEYHLREGALALTHTLVEPAYEGRGVGGALVKQALDEARSQGWTVLPFCPFVHAYLLKHPEYLDLVAADRRAQFELPAVPVGSA
jgi:predicted GNAT family acetyltransferase